MPAESVLKWHLVTERPGIADTTACQNLPILYRSGKKYPAISHPYLDILFVPRALKCPLIFTHKDFINIFLN